MVNITDAHEHAVIAISAFITGGGLVRWGNKFSKSMAPLPANAGWWTTTIYNFIKSMTGHDPTTNPPKPTGDVA